MHCFGKFNLRKMKYGGIRYANEKEQILFACEGQKRTVSLFCLDKRVVMRAVITVADYYTMGYNDLKELS